MSRLLLIGVTVLIAGCHLGGACDTAKLAFDFGPLPPREGRSSIAALPRTIVVTGIAAPGWMDNSSMYYRLLYRNEATPMAYARSRWVMPPAELLTQHLRWTLASGHDKNSNDGFLPGEPYVLHGELVEFEQIFDLPDESHGALRLRLTLEQRNGNQAQRTFEIERAAPSANAEGGVKALSLCADELSAAVAEWVAETIQAGRT
jgi:cholesterol transport system auxiliary component